MVKPQLFSTVQEISVGTVHLHLAHTNTDNMVILTSHPYGVNYNSGTDNLKIYGNGIDKF